MMNESRGLGQEKRGLLECAHVCVSFVLCPPCCRGVEWHRGSRKSSRGPVRAYTDLLIHDMGSDLAGEVSFGTPQLSASSSPTTEAEWRTAPLWGISTAGPYLHDGRADTLLSVLTDMNPDDDHGNTSQLSQQDLADLVAYLEALGDENDGFAINAGLNDAWYDPRQAGQGFFIIVFPERMEIFLAVHHFIFTTSSASFFACDSLMTPALKLSIKSAPLALI